MLHLEGDNYMIRSDNSDFENRQKSIFDQLDAVKVINHNENVVYRAQAKKFMKTDDGKVSTDSYNEESPNRKGKKVDVKHFKGKESIFKRPITPPPRVRYSVPDYQRNPHKWKKYSLCDVTSDDMSDVSNTAAAMAFLDEMKSRKSQEDESMDIDSKITFKQPLRPKATSTSLVIQVSKDDSPGEDGTSYFRGSKLIMPEYVVGEKKKPTKQSKHDKKDSSEQNEKPKEIKLNHLTEFEDEDDDTI